jgi:hypothetical protein
MTVVAALQAVFLLLLRLVESAEDLMAVNQVMAVLSSVAA